MYYPVSEYYKNKYGEKVMRLPINLNVSCPNRSESGMGCTYCSPKGAGFEAQNSALSIAEQLEKNMEYIGGKYGVKLFSAYFQNFSNTYQPAENLYEALMQVKGENIVEYAIATRPDCVSEKTAEVIMRAAKLTGREAWVELGLQSANFRTLEKINRGHSLAEFIDCVFILKKCGLKVCAHVILDLPGDTLEDCIECAKILSALRIDGVKLHSLYIPKGSPMETEYAEGKLKLCSDYAERAAEFLAYLSKNCVVHRLTGRIPEEDSVYANRWWEQKLEIEKIMKEKALVQGCKCQYLNGAALRRAGFEE